MPSKSVPTAGDARKPARPQSPGFMAPVPLRRAKDALPRENTNEGTPAGTDGFPQAASEGRGAGNSGDQGIREIAMRNILLGSAAAAALLLGVAGATAQYSSPPGGQSPASSAAPRGEAQGHSGAGAKPQAPMEHRSVTGTEKSSENSSQKSSPGATGQTERMPAGSAADHKASKSEMKGDMKSGEPPRRTRPLRKRRRSTARRGLRPTPQRPNRRPAGRYRRPRRNRAVPRA